MALHVTYLGGWICVHVRRIYLLWLLGGMFYRFLLNPIVSEGFSSILFLCWFSVQLFTPWMEYLGLQHLLFVYFPFIFVSFCFIYFGVLIVGAYMLTTVTPSWCIELFIIMKCPSLWSIKESLWNTSAGRPHFIALRRCCLFLQIKGKSLTSRTVDSMYCSGPALTHSPWGMPVHICKAWAWK